ncbi:MAG: hypothetical protein JO332_00275 [Planctomycetaceae bacterium]|nr:hypothetical protein [Planctomycetaceae bacterium]
MIRAGAVLAVALLAASCGPSSKKVIEKHRPAVEAKLASLRAIGAQLDKEPRWPGAAFPPGGPPPEFGPSPGSVNAIVLEPDCFAFPEPRKFGFGLIEWNPLADPVDLLRYGVFNHSARDGSAEAKARFLEEFAGLKYALVLHRYSVVDPEEKRGKLGSTKTFRGGRCDGEAVLFDIDRRVAIGGFPFAAGNSDDVFASTKNVEGGLISDLVKNGRQAVNAEFLSRYPTSTPPFRR